VPELEAEDCVDLIEVEWRRRGDEVSGKGGRRWGENVPPVVWVGGGVAMEEEKGDRDEVLWVAHWMSRTGVE
jgi:hypothetical protein